MYRSSPFRSTLNTGYITALDMCEVCTEAVHSVAPWTRVASQLWTSVKYEPPSDTFVHISTTFTRFYVSRTILRLHFRGAWFGNSTTLPRLYLWHPANSTTLTRARNQPGATNNKQPTTTTTTTTTDKQPQQQWINNHNNNHNHFKKGNLHTDFRTRNLGGFFWIFPPTNQATLGLLVDGNQKSDETTHQLRER